MDLNKKIGQRIKIIRLLTETKQKELAKELNVQASLLSLYEQGKREPSISFLKSFCDYTDMSLAQFFTLLEEPNKSKAGDEELFGLMKELTESVSNLEKINLVKNKSSNHA